MRNILKGGGALAMLLLLSGCYIPDLIDTDKDAYDCKETPRLKTEYHKIQPCFGGVSISSAGVSSNEIKGCEYDRAELDNIYKEYFYKKKHCNID